MSSASTGPSLGSRSSGVLRRSAERGKPILRYAGRDWALKRQAVDQKVDIE